MHLEEDLENLLIAIIALIVENVQDREEFLRYGAPVIQKAIMRSVHPAIGAEIDAHISLDIAFQRAMSKLSNGQRSNFDATLPLTKRPNL